MTITAPEMTESDHADNPTIHQTITVRSVDQQDNSIILPQAFAIAVPDTVEAGPSGTTPSSASCSSTRCCQA